MSRISPPLAILAELTHRCPLRCPYCSNPVALVRSGEELSTEEWVGLLRQASELGGKPGERALRGAAQVLGKGVARDINALVDNPARFVSHKSDLGTARQRRNHRARR